MTKAEKLVSTSYEQVNKGIYVWGARGQDVSAMTATKRVKWITEREESMKTTAATIANNIKRDIALYNQRVKANVNPILAFDCSGFVYWVQNAIGLGYGRRSAQLIYDNQCKHITESELTAGDLVFHFDGKKIVHVGIYVGDGLVNECKGRDVGVVTTDYRNARKDKNYWNRWGRFKKIPDPPKPKPEHYVYVKGGNVYVRKGGSTAYKAIGIAHKGETYPCLGTADTGWYHIEFKGKDGYISNRADLTELR